MFDTLLFAILPYLAVSIAVVGGLYRYFQSRISFSSLSSQLLENRQLFWGSIPWHYGIVILLVGHILGWIAPGGVAAFIGVPARLYLLEVTAFGLGLFALVGITALILRRTTSARVRAVTTAMDMLLLLLLLFQVVAGLYTAATVRWGSWWYISNAVPYLTSLVILQPKIQLATTMPLVVQLHILNAFLLVAIFPFSRLVHIFTLPITYLWRPYQQMVWNRRGTRGSPAE